MTDTAAPATAETDPWRAVVGQSDAVRRLTAAAPNPVHAYLFVGPSGSGKRQAAGVFGGEILAAVDPAGAERHRRLAAGLIHPDIVVFAPSGNALRLGSRHDPGEIPAIIKEASRSPTEGSRKIVVVEHFQTAEAGASSALLKLVEEPPASTIFVLLATDVPPHQITIESRCTRVDFGALAADDIAAALVAEGLTDPERAEVVAGAANGDLARARVLVLDERLAGRRDAWWSVPDRLDGTGAAVGALVEELRTMIDDASAARVARHDEEIAALEEREEQLGTRGSGRREMETRHKRELRQFRTDEVRFGLATLARRYRETVASGDPREGPLEAVGRIRAAADALIRNPNEALLLQALFVRLPPLG
ncbi:MAG: DNA polymerase III subunit delta' [Acidimicrobiales bacterium]|nr:MAG: DNA polymerase III subunit delta' [Acidimicrobiales bacterium]